MYTDLARFRRAHGQCPMHMGAVYLKLNIPYVMKISRSFACDDLDVLYMDQMTRVVTLAVGTVVSLYPNDVRL